MATSTADAPAGNVAPMAGALAPPAAAHADSAGGGAAPAPADADHSAMDTAPPAGAGRSPAAQLAAPPAAEKRAREDDAITMDDAVRAGPVMKALVLQQQRADSEATKRAAAEVEIRRLREENRRVMGRQEAETRVLQETLSRHVKSVIPAEDAQRTASASEEVYRLVQEHGGLKGVEAYREMLAGVNTTAAAGAQSAAGLRRQMANLATQGAADQRRADALASYAQYHLAQNANVGAAGDGGAGSGAGAMPAPAPPGAAFARGSAVPRSAQHAPPGDPDVLGVAHGMPPEMRDAAVAFSTGVLSRRAPNWSAAVLKEAETAYKTAAPAAAHNYAYGGPEIYYPIGDGSF